MPLKRTDKIGPQRQITLDELRDLVETTRIRDGSLTLDLKVGTKVTSSNHHSVVLLYVSHEEA